MADSDREVGMDGGGGHGPDVAGVMGNKGDSAVPFWQLFKYADRADYLWMAVGTCGAVAHGMVLPINMHFFGRIVNSLGQNQHDPGAAAAAVAKLALLLFIVALNSAWVTWIEVACWMYTGERQSTRIRTKYLESLLHQEVAFFDSQSVGSSGLGSGQVVSRIAEDTLLVQEAVGEKVGSFIHNLTTFAGGCVVGLVNSPPLALLTLAAIPLLSISGAFFNGKYMALAAQAQERCMEASEVVEETLSQVRTVYSFVGETRATTSFSKALDAASVAGVRSGLVKGLGIGTSLFFLNSSWALQLWYGTKLVAKQATDGGNILTTIFCVVFGGMALGQATQTAQIISRGRVAAFNIFQVIDRRSGIDSRDTSGTNMSAIAMQGRIELDDVCFAYPSRPQASILSGLSLTIPEATSTALVGGSGSGKSTVIALIQRLYDVSSGVIRIDGHDIRSLQLSWLRSTMGLVAQEPVLFATTIRANICLGALHVGPAGADLDHYVTQEQVEEAARAANVHSLICSLPDGYDTLVGERGVQLSGGQKQRIAIARAIVRSPKILLLDEATSALDAASERLVQGALDKLMQGRTTIVVAHRLSTIRHCDHIAVFHHGRIVEMGTHEELVSKPGTGGGVYSSMVQMQEMALPVLAMGAAALATTRRDESDDDHELPSPADVHLSAASRFECSQEPLSQAQVTTCSNTGTTTFVSEAPAPCEAQLPAAGMHTIMDGMIARPQSSPLVPIARNSAIWSMFLNIVSSGRRNHANADDVKTMQHHGQGFNTYTKMSTSRASSSSGHVQLRGNSFQSTCTAAVATVRDFCKLVGADSQSEWILVVLGSASATISGSLNPLFAFFLIDVVTLYYDDGRRPAYVRSHIHFWCLLFVALAVLAIFCNAAQHYLFTRTADHVSKKMRESAFQAVLKNEVGWFDREENGSSAVTARLASNGALVHVALSDATSLLLQYVASAVIAMTMGFVIQWRMALITILTFPFSMAGGSMKQSFMSKGFSGDLAHMHDKAMSLAGEAVGNIRTVASLGAQAKLVHLFQQQLSSSVQEMWVRAQVGGIVFGISQAALHSANACGLWYVAVLVGRREANYSDALKVFQVLAWTGYVLAEALSLLPDIKRGVLGADILTSITRRATHIDPDHGHTLVLPAPAAPPGPWATATGRDPDLGTSGPGSIRPMIRLEKVTFSYPSRPEVLVLKDFSLSVQAGTTAALVGASGSGKSSVFALLLRFYDPASGAILLDGTDISTVNPRCLRQHMSLVQQEPALFGSLTIADNIRYGNPNASEPEVVQAATVANAHTFICGLPDGYHTQVGERGVHLSGGQKQRIAIARAVLKDAPILLLDEATSALDVASECAVLEALDQQSPRKTVMVIAHRLSTVQNASLIFAVHNGRVVESGTHAGLLTDAHGLYSHLVGLNTRINTPPANNSPL